MDAALQPDKGMVLTEAIANLQSSLGLKQQALGEILGMSRNTVARTIGKQPIAPDSKQGELALLLIRVYRSLYAIVGNNGDDIRHWLQTGNHHLGGVPLELMKSVQGLCNVAAYLDAMRARV